MPIRHIKDMMLARCQQNFLAGNYKLVLIYTECMCQKTRRNQYLSKDTLETETSTATGTSGLKLSILKCYKNKLHLIAKLEKPVNSIITQL